MELNYSEWHGFRRADFTFEERDALIVFPDGNANGKWMIKMEYFDAFPELEIELLHRGWHLAYLTNKNRWGVDEDSDAKARFVKYMAAEFSLEEKVVCIGMSCGGLCSVNFAARHPSLVSFLDLDAPVMNLYSCPMGFGIGKALGGNSGWYELVDAYGFDMPTFLTFRGHPLDKIPALVENRIPVALLYGDSDDIVPYAENGIVLERIYKEHGLPLYLECRAGCGHHPHGPSDVKVLADFIEKHTIL